MRVFLGFQEQGNQTQILFSLTPPHMNLYFNPSEKEEKDFMARKKAQDYFWEQIKTGKTAYFPLHKYHVALRMEE